MTEYVVVGCGVIGLYTVFKLLENGIDPLAISVIAEHLPGDQSINYASPYAGAYFSASVDYDLLKYSNYTYTHLSKVEEYLSEHGIKKGGIGLSTCTSTELLDERETKGYLETIGKQIDDFEVLSDEELNNLSPESRIGIRYRAWIFNSPKFIGNLERTFRSAGVRIERKKLASIHEAYGPDTKAVFNCTGNGSKTLKGVADDEVYPTRGQVVVINGPHINECISRWSNDSTYIIKRPDSSSNEVILGGFYQPENGDANTYGFETEDILKRTSELYPELLNKNPFGNKIEDLQILRVVAGARPSRKGGVRIAKETLPGGVALIHNYGAGGCGYMCGLGMADEAVSLLDK